MFLGRKLTYFVFLVSLLKSEVHCYFALFHQEKVNWQRFILNLSWIKDTTSYGSKRFLRRNFFQKFWICSQIFIIIGQVQFRRFYSKLIKCSNLTEKVWSKLGMNKLVKYVITIKILGTIIVQQSFWESKNCWLKLDGYFTNAVSITPIICHKQCF